MVCWLSSQCIKREHLKSECPKGRKQALPVPWGLASVVHEDTPFCWSEQFRGQLWFRGRAHNIHLLIGSCHPHTREEFCWRASLKTGYLSVPPAITIHIPPTSYRCLPLSRALQLSWIRHNLKSSIPSSMLGPSVDGTVWQQPNGITVQVHFLWWQDLCARKSCYLHLPPPPLGPTQCATVKSGWKTIMLTPIRRGRLGGSQ